MPLLWASGASACQLSSSLMRRRAAPREEEEAAILGGVIESLIRGDESVIIYWCWRGSLRMMMALCNLLMLLGRPLLAKHPLRHQARMLMWARVAAARGFQGLPYIRSTGIPQNRRQNKQPQPFLYLCRRSIMTTSH